MRYCRAGIFATVITEIMLLLSTCLFTFGWHVEEHPLHEIQQDRDICNSHYWVTAATIYLSVYLWLACGRTPPPWDTAGWGFLPLSLLNYSCHYSPVCLPMAGMWKNTPSMTHRRTEIFPNLITELLMPLCIRLFASGGHVKIHLLHAVQLYEDFCNFHYWITDAAIYLSVSLWPACENTPPLCCLWGFLQLSLLN